MRSTDQLHVEVRLVHRNLRTQLLRVELVADQIGPVDAKARVPDCLWDETRRRSEEWPLDAVSPSRGTKDLVVTSVHQSSTKQTLE
jgi:hypothetical protein